ncbi:MAG TPA: GNAT family N-acetyltransferase [Terriglobales bacterium]|nr:GNAT family N-acetyltransferase [Terriglobales bacterium]
MRACVALQKEVWGFSDIELVPLRIFVVAEKIGGQVVGAFDNQELIGYAMAIPGVRNRHSFLYSQMLAVRKQYRNSGLGRRLKLFQREDGLARGFELMEWTFDPLEIKNAYLNIEKLGAIVRRYNINQYGITTSPLQAGLPTDRLIAEWWMSSDRVKAVLMTGTRPQFEVERTISVPAEIYAWKTNPKTRSQAQDVQNGNRAEFLDCFQTGLAVLGYERDSNGNGKFLLGRWNESWQY